MKRPAAFLVCALAAALLAWPAPGHCLDASAIYTLYHDSVVTVVGNRSFGTGFYVTPNLILTNYHVIDGNRSLGITFAEKKDVIKIQKIAGFSKEHDLALLYTDKEAEPIPVAAAPPTPGAEVAVIGTPRGLKSTVSAGNVSNLRKKGDTVMVQFTAASSHGSSGSPVIDAKTRKVVGIVQGGFDAEAGQNLNFAVAAEHIAKLLESVTGVPVDKYISAQTFAGPAPGTSRVYGWIDKKGVYCFGTRPPRNEEVEKMIPEQEINRAGVSFMGSQGDGDKAAKPQP